MRLLALTLLVGCTASDADLAPDATLAAEAPNLLRNGDFEELDGSSWAAGWQNLDLNPNGDIVLVDTAHSGSHALQWQMEAYAGDGREYWVTQHELTPQQLQPGHRYALTGWYHVDAGGEVWINYIVRGAPGDEPDLSSLGPGGLIPTVVGSWAPFRFEISIPTNVAPQTWDVSIHSIKFNHKATKLTIDDVRLFEIPSLHDTLLNIDRHPKK